MRQLSLRSLADLEESAQRRVVQSIGRVHEVNGNRQPYRDGYQTPFQGNILYYAQHALAICCRKCVQDWYGIPAGRDLNSEEVMWFVRLIMRYVEHRRLERSHEH